jgi:hypothetical protein
MNKVAALLIIFGSGLAAFGLSGWHATGNPLMGLDGPVDWNFSAGWPLWSQLEMTIGIMLLALGAILRRDSK